MAGKWLVGQLPFGAWIRVTGVVEAEWGFLLGAVKEDATTEYMKSIIQPGMTFVDVGANIGYFTLLAASQGAHVVAYEPTRAVFERLRENVALNGFDDVTVVNAAVAEKRGTLTLYESTNDPEANNLFGDGDHPVEVATICLDDDLAEHGVEKVDLLKVDVEGAEPLVLAGAIRLLRSTAAPTIVMELNPVALRFANSEPADLLNRLESSGYRCTELERAMYQGEIVVNILAVPDERKKRDTVSAQPSAASAPK
jgi:FkbM family methyltransferase